MKKVLLVLLLILAMTPIFCNWEYDQKISKDEFGDVINIEDYYFNGELRNLYSDKYILFYFKDGEYLNGCLHFGENNKKKAEESYTATIKVKEQDGNVLILKTDGKTSSKGGHWECLLSFNLETMNSLLSVFSRNDSVKIVVEYGEKNESYNYGEVTCEDFILNPTCILYGHNYDGGIVTIPAGCTRKGERTFTCAVCGNKRAVDIKALGHDVKNGQCSRCCVGRKGPAGGYIFYDCDEDNEYGNADGLKSDECGWRYLEAAPSCLSKKYIFGYYRKAPEGDNCYESGTIKFNESNCTGIAIGTGKRNTELLVNAMGNSAYCGRSGSNTTSSYAAKACSDYSYGGYSDWFLPSAFELTLMFANLKKLGIGNFPNLEYWTSSACGSDPAEATYMNNYTNYIWGERSSYMLVYPCRAFK